MPAVIASRSESFQLAYPFYKWANRSAFNFWVWQGLYATQFAALEFFFRGFMLAGLRKSFGPGAVFVMVVPYCMIHFGKPLPETLGAIVAGIPDSASVISSRARSSRSPSACSCSAVSNGRWRITAP